MKEAYNLICSFLMIVFSMIFFNSCSSNNKYSKENHLFTDVVADQLYSESYRIESFGVGGDVYSMYLTDSLSFRKFVSVYYDNESFEFIVENNIVQVIKKEESGGINNPKFKRKVIEEYQFSLNELKEKKEFE